jgi:hypothetical protein
MIAKAVVEPTGIEGTGAITGVNIWGQVDDSQTPNYQQINDAQTPTWTSVNDAQTPNWEEVA